MRTAVQLGFARPSTTLRGCLLTLALTLFGAATLAQAQSAPASLLELLPTESVLVLDLRDGAALGAALEPFLERWSAVGDGDSGSVAGLGDALAPLLSAEAQEALARLTVEVDLRALIAREALIAVSVTPFNPLPALTLIARIDPAEAERFAALIAGEGVEAGARSLQREGAIEFVAIGADTGGWASVQHADLIALSTQSDALRGVLRLLQGSTEPSLVRRAGVSEALAELGPGALTGFFDAEPLVRALAPLAGGLGFDASLAKLRQIAFTAGPTLGVAEFSSGGSELYIRGLRWLPPAAAAPRGQNSVDVELRELLLERAPAPRDALPGVGAGVVSLQLSNVDPGALWGYLERVGRGLPEWGVPDLNRTLRDLLGVDLRAQLLDGATAGVLIAQIASNDDAAADPWRGTVLGLHVADEAAAELGLRAMLDALGSRLALFIDPFGASAAPQLRELEVAGGTLLLLDLIDGLTVAAAVQGGMAYLATGEGALAALLNASGSGPDPELSARLAAVPATANTLRVGDARSALAGWRALVLGQLPNALQLIRAAEADEVAVVHAIEALERYLVSIEPLLGRSVGWTEVDEAGRIHSSGVIELPRP